MKKWIASLVLAIACGTAAAQDGPKENGVYVRSGEHWVKLSQASSSGFRSGGMGKTMLTGGAASIRSFMLFRDPSAPVSLSTSRPSFLIVGFSNPPRDIVIVRLERKKDHRELQIGRFNGYTGGGMEYRKEDVTEVDAKSDGPSLLVTPKSDLRPGEYIIFASYPTPFPAGYGGYDFEVKP